MKRRKPGKALARIALEVKDSTEFLDHVGGISTLYRREYALDATPRGSAARQSLKIFRKHAGALAAWLEQAHKGSAASAESDALDKVGELLHGAPHQAHAASKSVADWLTQADAAAGRCLDDVRVLPRKPQRNAPVIAGEALRATFEHHRLKVSTSGHADAVRLLCAIAKDAGDGSLTPQDAKQALAAGRKKPAGG